MNMNSMKRKETMAKKQQKQKRKKNG